MCFGDGGYNGEEAQRAAFEASRISITVVQRNDKQVKGFVVLPKRWVVERTLGWINRARRLAKDFEATIASALAWLLIALPFLLTRRLARLSTQPVCFSSRALTARIILRTASYVEARAGGRTRHGGGRLATNG